MATYTSRYDAVAQRRAHLQTGGVGHHGDVANILAAMGLDAVPPPKTRLETVVMAQLRDASEGLGANDLMVARTGRAVRVHEMSPTALADVTVAWRGALWQAAGIGAAIGMFQGILEETVGGNLTSQAVRGTRFEQDGGVDTGSSMYTDDFWLNATILVVGFVLSALVESHMLSRCALRGAGRMVALLGVHFAAETAAEFMYVHAVCAALLLVDPDGATTARLGVRLDKPARGACTCLNTVHKAFGRTGVSWAVKILARSILVFVARSTVRGFLPYLGVPLFAALNAIYMDRQLRFTWCRLAGIPAALEITEELLQTARAAKLRVRGAQGVAGGVVASIPPGTTMGSDNRSPVHWAPLNMIDALESLDNPSRAGTGHTFATSRQDVLSWTWSKVQSSPTTGQSRLVIAWCISQLLRRPQFRSARRQFEQGKVPSNLDLRVLAQRWWGDDTDTVAHESVTIVPSPVRPVDKSGQISMSSTVEAQVKWLRSWFEERVALMQMRRECSPLEPEGWDQLRRCCAALMIQNGEPNPVQELVLEYLTQQAGGNLLRPLLPEGPCVPVDDKAVSAVDVTEIIRFQAELTVEDREVVLCVLVLLVVVEGKVMPAAQDLLTHLLKQSHYTAPPSIAGSGSGPVLPTESWDYEELAQVAHEFGHFKRHLSAEDVMRVVSGVSVYDSNTDYRPTSTRLRIRAHNEMSAAARIKSNVQENLAIQREMLHRVGRKQLFNLHRNRLHSANGLVILWSALSLVVNSTALTFSSYSLHQLWLIILFNFYCLCTAMLGVLAVQKEWMGVFQSYFILHFLEILLNILLVSICFVSLPYVRDVVEENWTTEYTEASQLPKMIAWVRALVCGGNETADAASSTSTECMGVVVSTLRSYVKTTAWGGCAMFLLLALSVKSATLIIFASSSSSASSGNSRSAVLDTGKAGGRAGDEKTSLRRAFTLFLLTCCANMLLGLLFTAWGIFKAIWWPHPAEFWHVDVLILVRGVATFIQAFVGIAAARKVILCCLRAHMGIALVQLGISAFFIHSSFEGYYTWQSALTSTYVGEPTLFNSIPCDQRCSQGDEPAMPHLECFAVVGGRAPGLAIAAGWNGTTLSNDTLTQEPMQLGSSEIAAVLTELWSICDEVCSNDRTMCTARSYRMCKLELHGVARSPTAVASYSFLMAAQNATGSVLTLSNCTCSEHLNCVMGLKLGFLNQTNVLLVLSFVLLVLLIFDLATSYSLHGMWGVFVAHSRSREEDGELAQHSA